ncbi:hydroxymethylglutaryl-CoA lyase, mitochondrial-like [Vespa mandarinia]|uniref:hydroxymethylglutaryl-CoA lyase, mitochondrial-like n=1 Tax=Vespa mandarinia TaxID=7446 RepID=UPI0016138F27|nr:hydroxymethylglutaryl-CoA lyase, mitochondrial-like [Vespa mandarinia]XP_035724060.1 hydroxymethylglutaryl-CoA lyase, mitochondrial-like [Vespa mandarinia]
MIKLNLRVSTEYLKKLKIHYKDNIRVNNIRQYTDFVKVVEVGPRDGLQNEPKIVPTNTKIQLINKLSETGLQSIETTSFVSPKWIPQMADNVILFTQIKRKAGISYPVLVPNLKGLDSALKVGVKEIAIFGAASETFSKKNINCSINESIKNFTAVIKRANEQNIKVRGYISCIAGCPYEGEIKPKVVVDLALLMLNLGCYEISLGDTIGVGSPKKIKTLLKELQQVSSYDMSKFALHCHDTYGQALANIYASLEHGIRVFDSSIAGLGGCPYAAGASGNVATEDLLYLLHGQGLETGVNFNEIVEIGNYISKELDRKNQSKAGLAILAQRSH